MALPTHSTIRHLPLSETRKGKGLTRTLDELPPGHTILIGDKLPEPGTSTAKYTDRPEYGEGRHNSIQEVRFGDLTVSSPEATLSTQPIALKPYNKSWLAAQDFRTACSLNRDRKVTFEPLGFTKIDDKIALLTRFEQGVVSFDNILWGDSRPEDREIEWSLVCAATTLIFLHGNGRIHGDFQVKNTAYDINLQPRVIDTTTMRQRQDPCEFGKDIICYIESLSRFGRQAPYPSEEQVRDMFIGTYHDTIDDIFPHSRRQNMKEIIASLACRLDNLINGR